MKGLKGMAKVILLIVLAVALASYSTFIFAAQVGGSTADAPVNNSVIGGSNATYDIVSFWATHDGTLGTDENITGTLIIHGASSNTTLDVTSSLSESIAFNLSTWLPENQTLIWSVNYTNTTDYSWTGRMNVYVDRQKPTNASIIQPIEGHNFSTTDVPFIINSVDDTDENITCEISVNSTIYTVTTLNNTESTHYITLPEGRDYNTSIRCYDNFSNTYNNATIVNFSVDVTDPSVSILDPTPADDSAIGYSSMTFNLSYYDLYNSTCTLELLNYTSDTRWNRTMTDRSAPGRCDINISGWTDGRVQFKFFVNDTADNEFISAARNVTVDLTDPSFGTPTAQNLTGNSDSEYAQQGNVTGFVNWSVSDQYTNITSCSAIIIDAYGNRTTKTGVVNATGSNNSLRQCWATFNVSDVVHSGKVTVELRATDEAGNVKNRNLTNFTATRLYTGWNLIEIQKDTHLGAIGNLSSYISYVSNYSTVNKEYTTYTVGTTGNETVPIFAGDAAYIYTSQDIGIVSDLESTSALNTTLTKGWNQLAHLNRSSVGMNMTQLCNYQHWNATAYQPINYISYYNASEGMYRGFYCHSGYVANAARIIPYGYGFWMYSNSTINLYMERELS